MHDLGNGLGHGLLRHLEIVGRLQIEPALRVRLFTAEVARESQRRIGTDPAALKHDVEDQAPLLVDPRMPS